MSMPVCVGFGLESMFVLASRFFYLGILANNAKKAMTENTIDARVEYEDEENPCNPVAHAACQNPRMIGESLNTSNNTPGCVINTINILIPVLYITLI
jgi:hypothetical protein